MLSIFLLTVLTLQFFSKFEIYLLWQLNRNYISKTLCVNKNAPQKHCNGKCFMKKQLQADEATQKNLPSSGKSQEIQWFFGPTNPFHMFCAGAYLVPVLAAFDLPTHELCLGIFRPPRLA